MKPAEVTFNHSAWSPPMPHATPIVFVVDDDISVRESLELLISNAGWLPETFESGDTRAPRPPRITQPPRAGGHGIGCSRAIEQAGRFRARH